MILAMKVLMRKDFIQALSILLLLQLHEVFPQDREHQTLHPVGNQSCLEATTKQAHHTVFLYHMLHHVDIAGK